MRKAVAWFVLCGGLLLFPGLAFSETVMLYTQMQLRSEGPDRNLDRFAAIEDGVMSLFFDSGHIIFDTGMPQQPNLAGTNGQQSETWAIQEARKGGADFLLEVSLSFPDAPYPAVVPLAIHYKLKQLANGLTLAEGDVTPAFQPSEVAEKKPYDLCFALGQEVARHALAAWQQVS